LPEIEAVELLKLLMGSQFERENFKKIADEMFSRIMMSDGESYMTLNNSDRITYFKNAKRSAILSIVSLQTYLLLDVFGRYPLYEKWAGYAAILSGCLMVLSWGMGKLEDLTQDYSLREIYIVFKNFIHRRRTQDQFLLPSNMNAEEEITNQLAQWLNSQKLVPAGAGAVDVARKVLRYAFLESKPLPSGLEFSGKSLYYLEWRGTEISDEAQGALDKAATGGIDFAQSNLDMQIKRDGAGVPLPISQQNLDNIRIDGLVPVILSIQPAANVSLLN
jgi:hypothetical protein